MKTEPIQTKTSNTTDRSSFIKNMIENKKPKSGRNRTLEIPKILMLTTFPPRECGIATYSQDLIASLEKTYGDSLAVQVCQLYDTKHPLKEECDCSLDTDSPESYEDLAAQIDQDRLIKLVMIQHEFGLYNGCDSTFIDFLKSVKKPVIVGFHTVIPSPDSKFLEHVKSISEAVSKITVMTKTSKDILVDSYGISDSKIEVITHGTHLVKHMSRSKLKMKYGLENKKILSTFGFLGPGKSIETTLNALPEVVNEFPEVKFLVLGKTHPTLLKNEGEAYRNQLQEKIKALKLENNVEFVNEFLPLENLLEYLQLTDIYIFSSKDPNQAVSGTFSYAMSCGCAIVSTPIPHAKESIAENNGLLFDFGDSKMLADQLKVLLKDDDYRNRLGKHALHASAATSWENSALQHGELFNKNGTGISLKYHKPDIKFDHLIHMTTKVGMIQFSKLNKPDLKSGYTLDDNARALVVASHSYKYTKDETMLKQMKTYLRFIVNCQRFNGSFLNYVDENEQFTDQNDDVNLEDSNGRAIWALGEFLTLEEYLPSDWSMCFHRAKECINEFLPTVKDINSPRSMAFIIKGLQPTSAAAQRREYVEAIRLMGNKLLMMYEEEVEENWKWPEPYLTYGNSVIPEAFLKCYQLTYKEAFKVAAYDSFNFLLSHIFKNGQINVISNQTWFSKGDHIEDNPDGGQQPIDVAYTVLALKEFMKVFPNEGYQDKMEIAFEWFLGKNHLNQIIYNPCTNGCFDGLEKGNVNLNQGAESTVSYLMARLAFEDPSLDD